MLQAIKRVIFWTYSRGSWQYDILCVVILCFIFLTPRAVFDGSAFLDENQNRVPGQQGEPEEKKQASAVLSIVGDSEPQATEETADSN